MIFTSGIEPSEPFPVRPERGYGSGRPESARVILFGIDGATWNMLTPLLDQKLLPNFERLLKCSSYGWMATDEALSPISWTSIATGKRREKTLPPEMINESLWATRSGGLLSKRLWDILSPPDGQGLAIINYYFTPTRATYPQAVLYGDAISENEVREPFGDFGSILPFPAEIPPAMMKALGVLEQGNFNFLAYTDRESDYLQHLMLVNFYLRYKPSFQRLLVENADLHRLFDRKVDSLFHHYRNLDAILGKILDRYPNDYLFVVSDHGFQTDFPSWKIGLADLLLKDVGILEEFDGITEKTPFMMDGDRYIIERVTRERELEYLRDQPTGQAIPMIAMICEYRISAANPRDSAAARRLEQAFEKAARGYGSPEVPAFFIHRQDQGIRVAVSDAFLDDMMRRGIEIPGARYNTFSNHSSENSGILIAHGPGIAKGRILAPTTLFDVTPTILYLKGMPVGKDMDGRVIAEMIAPRLLADRPVGFIPTYETGNGDGAERPLVRSLSPEERERLKTMGYLR